MKCAKPPQRPLQWLHKHAYTQTHCATTPHSTCLGNTHTYTRPNTTYNATAPVHTHTYTPATSRQPTNQPTKQPTNQPAKLICPRTNLPTTNQPTKQSENQQPTNQQARYQCTQRGGGSHNLGGGGTKHTTDPHSTAPDATRPSSMIITYNYDGDVPSWFLNTWLSNA